MKTVVAMSGGVDSAVAAALLVRDGHDVEGLTLRLADLSSEGLGASRCCSLGDIEMAARVCWQLGIPHRVLDLGTLFREEVLDPFVAGYLAGETPSPCARCNARVKLGAVIPLLPDWGADALATGHYARCVTGDGGEPQLLRGRDPDKDQSYFLFELGREALVRVRFPLGELRKSEVRAVARELALPNAASADSQEMCFVPPGGSYLDVVQALAGDRLPSPGEIVDRRGNLLGRHCGVHRFTVGQRRGLGLAAREPRYVVAIEPDNARVVVGDRGELLCRRLVLRDTCWLEPPASPRFDAEVQVRYRHRAQPARVEITGAAAAEVLFPEGVVAPAPGQAAVCYTDDRVLGGGWIAEAT
jgi:tRNA-uridine 2-sulfurtransferase